MRRSDFETRLEAARVSGRPLLDLAESDPARCGLAWDPEELASILGGPHAREAAGGEPEGLGEARDAVASYLAGEEASVSPDRVFLVRSRSAARRIVLEALGARAGEVIVPSPRARSSGPVKIRRPNASEATR